MNQLNRMACIALAMFLFSACSRNVTVKIGVVGPMTGILKTDSLNWIVGACAGIGFVLGVVIGSKKPTFKQ